ncbi:MAG: hypothetical protein ACE5HX_03875, partial [bacterium]
MYRTLMLILLVSTPLLIWTCGDKEKQANKEKGQQMGQEGSEATAVRPLDKVAPKDRLNYYSQPPAMIIDEGKRYIATIHTKKGDITIDLDAISA